MAFGVFSSYIRPIDEDPDKCIDRRGLGSYCSLVTKGDSGTPVRIVTYYRPSDESRRKLLTKKGRQTVFAQHMRAFKLANRPDLDPREEADRCLVEDLKRWKDQGEEIILLGDFNQCIYTSDLAKILTGPDLEMSEQFKAVHEVEAPYSYIRGKRPIMGCYATTGIEVKAYFI